VRGFGIDFGTTNSVVATCDSSTRRPSPLLDAAGRPHPSVVWFRADGSITVGRRAKSNLNSYADEAGNAFIPSIKRHLGKDKSFRIFTQPRSAVEIASKIFSYLRTQAATDHGVAVDAATVTIPIYFDGNSRRELRQAADKAGIYIKTFVHEPFAAVVGYCCSTDANRLEQFDKKNIMVFDWGGGTLDVTIAGIRSGRITQLSRGNLNDRAGDSFDHKLHQLTLSRFLDANDLRPPEVHLAPNAKDRYLAECERAKITLSTEEDDRIQVAQAIQSDRKISAIDERVTRPDLESLIHIDVKDALAEVDNALKEARLTSREIDLVLLIGGSSLIPLVQRQMTERFGARIVQVPNADTIIAEGAALIDSLGMQPVLARAIGVRLSDESFYEIFPAGSMATPAVCTKTVNFFCTDNRDGEAKVILVERVDHQEITKPQVLSVPVNREQPHKHADHERIVITFRLDDDLVLHVTAKGATQPHGRTIEVHDLLFALNTREAGTQ
jgi:molecular chaperone DnaK